ncbi:ASCH domain-containing protein [Actinoplanes couchii]|uniref:ASCH domain-containing protein n=1 Tax=Actinoplanes couchii TaxID=403638 RepID=A0ABQ3XU86_9ACTN|nr:ASCH domain-containing protein [Actinoplanes couchii]MDR6324524.1 uncharacterized protein YhfF [Actinoplanes couchii]GID62084.1 hypothetical protein Aco03nite_104880 [Actinoplanes couchii]
MKILELAEPGPLRDCGVNAILAGTKTAMTGLPAIYYKEGEPLPTAGERYSVIDSAGKPVAVIELTRVATEPIGAVGDAYAQAEGRGYRDAADWWSAHEAFFRSDFVAEYLGFVPDFDDGTLVVTQWFQLIETLS